MYFNFYLLEFVMKKVLLSYLCVISLTSSLIPLHARNNTPSSVHDDEFYDQSWSRGEYGAIAADIAIFVIGTVAINSAMSYAGVNSDGKTLLKIFFDYNKKKMWTQAIVPAVTSFLGTFLIHQNLIWPMTNSAQNGLKKLRKQWGERGVEDYLQERARSLDGILSLNCSDAAQFEQLKTIALGMLECLSQDGALKFMNSYPLVWIHNYVCGARVLFQGNNMI